jgi:hypothetical protein
MSPADQAKYTLLPPIAKQLYLTMTTAEQRRALLDYYTREAADIEAKRLAGVNTTRSDDGEAEARLLAGTGAVETTEPHEIEGAPETPAHPPYYLQIGPDGEPVGKRRTPA